MRTTVGLKVLMAVSGALLVLFLVAHMLGNLKAFAGAAPFDGYADWLTRLGEPVLPEGWYLWFQRAALGAAVVAHIAAATALTIRAKRARPVRYVHRATGRNYAARTMRWGGVIIALFVVYHLLDLTTGQLNPVGGEAGPYADVVADFAPGRWYVTAFYALAIVALGFHLRHGLYSAARTLGQHTARGERRARAAAAIVAAALCAGYLSVPLAVVTGAVR